MEKLFTLLLITLSFSVLAQTENSNMITFSLGGDIRNCTVGSAPTNNEPKADLLFKLTIRNNGFMEYGLGAEVFPSIDYNKVFVSAGARLDLFNDLSLIGTLEPSVISRTEDWGGGISEDKNRTYVTGASSLILRYKPLNNIFFEVQGNITYREDLVARYDESNPFKPSVFFSIGIDLSEKIRRWY